MLKAPPTQPPVVERRLVSVLFADLVGFTAWSAGRDPEDVRELLSGWFAFGRSRIEQRGGTVEKFIGDAVMAAWGALVAGEDDAEQAVLAALDVVNGACELGDGIEARAAVTTGEVAVTVGAVGEGMVAGEVVNAAARLQAAAEPGTILVGSATMLAASSRVAFAPAGELRLKGIEALVPAWRAIGAVAGHRERDRPGALVPDLVGREAELDRVAALVAGVATERRARLVLLVGEAGVGKTRLARELRRRMDASASEPLAWFEGHVPADRGGGAFAAWAEIVRAALGPGAADDDATRRRTLETALDHLAIDDADRRWVEPALLALLGLAPAPRGGRDVLFAGWRILLERLVAARGLTVLAFDDLHEAQPDLLDFLDHVATWAKTSPIMLLGLGRPEVLGDQPAWEAERGPTTVVRLLPLAPDAVGRLLAGVVEGLPESLARTIVERADGVPLYAVETLRMLLGEGLLLRDGDGWRPSPQLAGIGVPDSLRELIAARLDAAGPADRALLEDAAVLGVRFGTSALAVVSAMGAHALQARLADLVRREFLVSVGDAGARSGDTYAFVHPLVREVAYATLARADRRARHLRAAGHFAALDAADAVGDVAAHYLGAYRASRAGLEADELVEQTRVALRAAAERAQALGAHDQAVSLVEQALALPMTPGEEAALREVAARSANVVGHNAAAERYARRVLVLREADGDPAAVARATASVAMVLRDAGRVADAIPMLEDALGRLPQGQGAEAEAALQTCLSRAYFLAGRYEESLAKAERALALAEPLDLDSLVAEALLNRAGALGNLGRSREAILLEEGVIRLAHAAGLVDAENRARNNLGASLAGNDILRGLALSREVLELERKLGWCATQATSNVAWGLFFTATDWDGALASVEELLATDLEPADRVRLEGPVIIIHSARGDLESGRFAAHERLVQGLADPAFSATLEHVRSNVAWCRSDFDAALRCGLAGADYAIDSHSFWGLESAVRGAIWLGDLARARSLAERVEKGPLKSARAEAVRSSIRGCVAALEGRTADGAAHFQAAIQRWRGAGYDWPAAETALDFARAAGPQVPEARAAAEEAREVFERVRARVYVERLDAVTAGVGSSSVAPKQPGAVAASAAVPRAR